MEGIPAQKPSGDLMQLQRVNYADVQPGKFYFVRVRNKDKGPDVWGYKMDFVAEINKKDNVGISFFTYFERSGEPRDGVPRWTKTENMVLIPTEAITNQDMDDNTTFYIINNPKIKSKGTRRNKTKLLNSFRRFFGFTRRQQRQHR